MSLPFPFRATGGCGMPFPQPDAEGSEPKYLRYLVLLKLQWLNTIYVFVESLHERVRLISAKVENT